MFKVEMNNNNDDKIIIIMMMHDDDDDNDNNLIMALERVLHELQRDVRNLLVFDSPLPLQKSRKQQLIEQRVTLPLLNDLSHILWQPSFMGVQPAT